MSKRLLSTNIMSGAHNGRTTLLDLPEELLSSCLPWDDSNSIRASGAVCKRLLEVLLMGNSSGRLGLSLQLQEPHHVPEKRASLLLALQFFPKLQKVKVLSKGLLRNHLAHLFAVPQGSYQLGAHWLYGITHMHLGDISTEYWDTHLLFPHPVPSQVAMACPNLRELTLYGMTFSKQDQWALDRLYHEQRTRRAQCLNILKRMEGDCKSVQQLFEQSATEVEVIDPVAAMRNRSVASQYMLQYQHVVQLQTELQMQAPQDLQTNEPAPPACLPHLRKLSMRACDWGNSGSALQQQLQMLPSLQELVMSGFSWGDYEEECAAATAGSCSSRLLQLQWDAYEPQAATALLSKPWAQLQQLQLCRITVDDAIMKLLLQHTPSLRTVQIAGFQLQHDFSHRPCSWKTIIMRSGVDIASLPRLPLSTVTELCAGRPIGVYLGSTVANAAADEPSVKTADTAAAAVAVMRCGGIHPRKGDRPGVVSIEMAGDQAFHMGQMELAVLPLLSNITKAVNFQGVHVTRDLLIAINSHLPHCSCAGFRKGCTFESGIWGSMVSLLPNIMKLDVWSEHAALHQLQALCAAADHPVQLCVLSDQFDPDLVGWQDESQESAMGRPVEFEFR